ncbi:MAG TPA: polyprenyl synthetase family protein, partial [Oscillospiraceae bacterium]|nr:polyprenyl synthetase family protein [Oscillospiraceae bacterium]
MENETFRSILEEDRRKIGDYLSERVSAETSEQALIAEAMRYAVLGGKRLRGILALEFCRLFGGAEEDALPFAA